MDKPKVFIPKYQPDWEFGPASDYGSVVFLTDKEIRPEPTTGTHNENVISEMMGKFSDYKPGYDYIVMTASMVNNAVVCRTLRKGVRHNLLRWVRRDHVYRLYKI